MSTTKYENYLRLQIQLSVTGWSAWALHDLSVSQTCSHFYFSGLVVLSHLGVQSLWSFG